jgi:hypothetical protein
MGRTRGRFTMQQHRYHILQQQQQQQQQQQRTTAATAALWWRGECGLRGGPDCSCRRMG